MAKVTSGSFNTTDYSGRYLVFSWTCTQSIENNTSSISWTLKGAGSASGYYKAAPFTVVIAGDTVYSSSTRINLYSGTLVASGTKVITHDTDGTKSFSASVQAAIYSAAVNCSGSASWDLKDIPRGAKITAAPNFNDEANPTISYSNPAGASVTSLQVCISLDGTNADIAYRDTAKTGTSYTFNLTAAEREILRAATTKTSRSVKFHIKTVIAGNTFYNSVAKTFTIVNAAPVIVADIYDTGTISKNLTGDANNKIIKGYNDITAKVTLTALKGASIKEYKVSCGGKVVDGSGSSSISAKLYDVESGTFTVTATDSRGFTTTLPIQKTLIEHFKPTCTLVKNNLTTAGEFTVNLSGKFFSGSFGAKNNTLNTQFRFRESGGTYSEWQSISPALSGNDYTASAVITGLNYQNSYDIQARAFDAIGASDAAHIVETEALTITAIPVFSYGKGCFEHHTHTFFDNAKIIFGVDADGNYHNAFEPCTIDNKTSVGYGGYSKAIGSTDIFGNEIKFISKTGFTFNGITLNDFITEQGTSGAWGYRKYKSGLCECWRSLEVNTPINTAWGSMYVGSYKMSRQNYPFTFASKPVEFATLLSGSNACWLFAESGGNGVNGAYATAIYNICRPTAVTASATYYINLYAIGYLNS